jgi:polyferredoxin
VDWARVRRATQVAFLLVWLVLWLATAGLAWNAQLLRLPAELDPLLALAQLVASRTLTLGMLLSLVVIVLTILFGRVWCGWICPVGTTLDLFAFEQTNRKDTKIPDSWRMGKYLLLLAVLIAALFGNLSMLVLDPITIWIRTLTGGIGPALNTAFTAAEKGLAAISWMRQASAIPPRDPSNPASVFRRERRFPIFKRTPPTSVLWEARRERSLTATG